MKVSLLRHFLVYITLFALGIFIGKIWFGRALSTPLMTLDSLNTILPQPDSLLLNYTKSEDSESEMPELLHRIRQYEALDSDALSQAASALNNLRIEDQALATTALFSVWATQDPEAALRGAKGLGSGKDAITAMILSEWVKQDASQAVSYYKKNERNLFTYNYQQPWEQTSPSTVIADAIAQRDGIDAAIHWAQQLNHRADSGTAIAELIKQQVSIEPKGALSRLNQLSSGERDYALKAIAQSWPLKDQDAATDWINSLNELDQELVMQDFIAAVALNTPKAASDYLQYVSGNRDDAIHGIVESWTELSPQDAANWLIEGTTIEEQGYFIGPILEEWIVNDPATAKAWVLGQADGASKDEAAHAYIQLMKSGTESPQALLAIAKQSIRNPQKQERAMTDVLVAWARVDAESSKEYAMRAGLSNSALADYFHESNAQEPLE